MLPGAAAAGQAAELAERIRAAIARADDLLYRAKMQGRNRVAA